MYTTMFVVGSRTLASVQIGVLGLTEANVAFAVVWVQLSMFSFRGSVDVPCEESSRENLCPKFILRSILIAPLYMLFVCDIAQELARSLA